MLYPHTVFMCSVRIWEQTVIISLYSINWLVFITEGLCLLRGTSWIFKTPYTFSVKLSEFTVWRHIWWKNWVNCAVVTGNSVGLRTALSSRLSHTELLSSLRESHSFPSSPADTTIASSQSTFVFSNSFSRWASHDTFLCKYHFLLHILRFRFFFSDKIMADVASKEQTTALFLSTIVTRTRRHTKLTNLMGNLWCARGHSVQFFVQFFYTVKLHNLT